MLDVTNISYERDERLLFSHLSFSVMAGEIVQITGANGCGKTTVLKMLTGLLLPTNGDVTWQQQPLRKVRSSYYNELLYIGHQAGITSLLTPIENLEYYLEIAAKPHTQPDIRAILMQIGLETEAHKPSYLLSAGQQRRIALARLLCSSAKLWILDEPLTALDRNGIQLIEQLLISHIANQGMVVMTSHQPLALGNIVAKEVHLIL